MNGPDRTVVVIGGGIVAIVVAAVIVVLALGEPSVITYPVDSPEGTVQRYLQAVYDGDIETARKLLSERAAKEMGDDPYGKLYCQQVEGHQVRIKDVDRGEQRATVHLRIEETSGSGLGFDRYEWDRSVTLVFEGESWKIDEPYFCA